MPTPRFLRFLWSAVLLAAFADAQAATSVTLTPSQNPSPFGQQVTLTATVTSGATGRVTFYDGVNVLGTSTISGSQAAFTTRLLPSGTRYLRAYYLGTSGFGPSSSVVMTQTVVAQPSLGLKPGMAYNSFTSNSNSIAVGDVNGDGKPDVIELANNDFSAANVFLGNGDGTFQAAISVNVSGPGRSAALGDFNGDGKSDLAIVSTLGALSVLPGNGDGTFGTPVGLIGTGVISALVADLDNDGNADLVVSLYANSANQVGVLRGNGDGTFRSLVTSPAPNAGPSASLAVGDFNSDGNTDVVVGWTLPSGFGLLLGNGDGTFQALQTVATPSCSCALVVADLDRDGKADVAVTSGSQVYVLLGNGNGSFQPPVAYPSGSFSSSTIVGDLNGDGVPDLIVPAYLNSKVYVLIGNGDGSFQAPYTYNFFEASVVIAADFNGDGRTDLAITAPNLFTVFLGGALPDLSISLAHGAGFIQGQIGASYIITVTNVGQIGTVGGVGVVNALPSGFTATAISGSGWTCVLATLACTRSDSLAVNASYPIIKIIANIAANLTGITTDTAIVSGGSDQNSSNNTASSTVFIRTVVPVSLTSSPNPSTPGQLVTLTASINPAATGEVTFYDGASILGSAALSGGTAMLMTEQLTSGTNNLTAEYGGNSTYGFSVSPVRVQTVSAIPDNAVAPSASYRVDQRPQVLLTADFNRDGIPDLATVNTGSGSGSISVLLGNGNGTFLPAVNYPGAPNPTAAVVADFNLDGKADLVIAGYNSISIVLGNGDGSVQSAVAIYQQNGIYNGVAVGDVNRDGVPDLIATSDGSGVAVFMGNGDGTFQPPIITSIMGSVLAAGVADVDGDGTPDIVFSNGYNYQTSLGNSDGTFQPPLNSGQVATGQLLAVGDFNGDGKPDLAVTTSFSQIAFLAGNGDGTFQSPVTSTTIQLSGSSAIAGDFNGDGRLDIGSIASGVTLALGNGLGTFQLGGVFSTDGSPGNIVLADFNADGKPDFAVLNQGGPTVNIFLGQQLSGLALIASHPPYFISGQTGATFQLAVSDQEFTGTSGTVTVTDMPPSGLTVTAASGTGWACSLSTAVTCTRSGALAAGGSYPAIAITMNVSASLSASTLSNRVTISSSLGTVSIGDPMVIVLPTTASLNVTSSSSTLGQPVSMTATLTPGATGRVLFLDDVIPLGDSGISSGQAQFTTSLLPSGGHKLRAVYNGDSMHGPSSSSNVAFTVNAAAESGFATPIGIPTGAAPLWIAFADLNNDGKGDLVTANSAANTVSVLLGNGDGTFHPHVDYNVGTMPVCIAVGDLNGDGKPDLAAVNQTSGTLSVLLGNGDGTFQSAVDYAAGANPTSVAFGDFNGDGKEDLIVTTTNYGSVYFGNGDGTLQTPNPSPGFGTPPILVGDFNGDGKADLAAGDFVLLGNGDGTFPTQTISFETSGGVALGDLNGDGKTDLVFSPYSSVSVVLGSGDGNFTFGQSYSIGFFPTSLAIADVNGDGKLDVIAIGESASLVIFFGNGDGTLQAGTTYNLGFTPTQIAVGEFNGDGRTDLAFAVSSSNSVDVLLGVYIPVLSITSSHGANFYLNETGATYTLTVTNQGPGSTNGTITVVDTLPFGLTATAIGGTGWACVPGTLTCTRSDSLGVGVSYPAITVTVNVSSSASSPVINLVNASGGGSVAANAADSTTIGAIPSPVLTSPVNGATGVSTTASLNWSTVASATSYDVYFGTSSTPPFVTNTAATTYSPGTLAGGTVYYWNIVAQNASGTGSSATWSFTTQVPPPVGMQFYPVTPCRLVDTRGTAAGFNGIAPFSGPSLASGATLTIPVQSAAEASANTTPAPCGTIPSTAQAYSLNVTVVPHVLSTDQYPGVVHYISLWPSGAAQPYVSTLNDSEGQILANAAIVPAGTPNGGISIYNAGPATADVILDMNGYFAATTTQGAATGLLFNPVSPCRLVDTRGPSAGFNGISPFSGPSLLSGAMANFPVQSSAEASADTTPAPCGTIPSGAQAYSLNTTVVPHAGALDHFITLWPSGLAQPSVSTLNDQQGEVVANAAIVPAGSPSGGVSVFNEGPATADVILDMNGYFAAPSGLKFYPVSPCRLADTRGTSAGFNGISPFSGPSIAAGATITIPVQSSAEAAANTTPAPCGTIPSSAQAYSLNLTVVPKIVVTDAFPGAIDYVTMWPAGVSQPIVSTVNDQEGLVVANAAIVPAGSSSGGISVYNAGPSATDVVIDMNGYFAP